MSYSAQQLVDCAGPQGGLGCVGGFAFAAYDYIKAIGGLETEDAYPYEDDDNRCRFNGTKVVAKVTSYTNVTKKDENALQQAVATIGPDRSSYRFQPSSISIIQKWWLVFLLRFHLLLSSESFCLVYHQLFCSENVLDRSLLVVGYGTDTGKDFWLVKNRSFF